MELYIKGVKKLKFKEVKMMLFSKNPKDFLWRITHNNFLQGFQDKSVCFYPSCGRNFQGLLDLPYELFVLSDYRFFKLPRIEDAWLYVRTSEVQVFHRERDDKWVVFFGRENNKVLRRIQSAGLKLSCFIGKNDGCREGGNHECVNEWTFFRKVLRVASDRMVYITDHWRRSRWHRLYRLIKSPSLFKAFCESKPADVEVDDPNLVYGLAGWVFIVKGVLFRQDSESREHFLYPFYSEETVEHLVLRHPQRIRGISFKKVHLSFEFDDIAIAIEESDGLVVSRNCFKKLEQEGLSEEKAYIVNNWRLETNDAKVFMEQVLRLAYERKWRVVSVLPFGGGRHRGILEAAKDWKEDLPEVVRIFHIHPKDFNDIEEELTKIC